MPVDVFDHMEEAWKLESNPFPLEAIRAQHTDQPYSPEVYTEEANAFRRKFVRAGVRGGQALGFLWSQGVRADTGFGKTTLMQEISREINRDLGATTLQKAGASKASAAVAAAFTNLNNLNAAGLYPVLFNAVVDLATPAANDAPAIFDKAYDRIAERVGGGEFGAIAAAVREAWASIGGTAGPLRTELITAFAGGRSRQLRAELASVSQTARLRNGLQYLNFALAVLAAGGIDRLFLMIDQLEDLATNRSVTSSKRSREIGRIRDLLESAPYATRLHMIFTFHNRAAQVLDRYWEENRLPSFEISSSNTSAVVVLGGLKDDEQAKELLRVYLDDARTGKVDDDLLPFEPGAVAVLREVSDGRPGVLLSKARELLNAAAEQALPKISAGYAQQYFDGQAPADDGDDREEALDGGDDIDDLLLGRRKT